MRDDILNEFKTAANTRVVDWEQWLAERRTLQSWRCSEQNNRITVALATDLPIDHPELGSLAAVDSIVIWIESFTDGRVFGLARLLRNKVGFEGSLQASGDYLLDQISFLKRVGFDSFLENSRTGKVGDYYSGFYQPDTNDAYVSIRAARIEKRG